MRNPLFSAALLAAMAATGGAYAQSDEGDFNSMYNSLNELMQFAAPGRSVKWSNEVTGNKGKITTHARVDRSGRQCWSYDRTYSDRARKTRVKGVACEKFPGLWEIIDEGPEELVAGKSQVKSQAKSQTSAQTKAPEPTKAPTTTQTAATPKQAKYDRYTVRETQKLLTNLGYNPGPVDGAYGSKTRRAIERFERDRSYPVTGKPSPALIARLREADSGVGALSPSAQPTAEPAVTSPSTPGPASEPTTAATTTEPASLEAPVMLEATPPVPDFEPLAGPTPSASSGAGSDSSTVSGLPPPPPPPPSD